MKTIGLHRSTSDGRYGVLSGRRGSRFGLHALVRTDGGWVEAGAVQTLTMEWKFEAVGKTYSIVLFYMLTFMIDDIASIPLLLHADLSVHMTS